MKTEENKKEYFGVSVKNIHCKCDNNFFFIHRLKKPWNFTITIMQNL